MKLRINLRRRFPLEDVMLFFSALCVFSYALLRNVNLALPLFSTVKFPVLYAGAVCTLFQVPVLLKNVGKRRYFYTISSLMLFCVLIMLAAYANRKPVVGYVPLRYTCRLVLYLLELYALMIWAAEKGKVRYLLNFLFHYTLILVLVTDLLLFTRLAVFYSGRHELYLIGNKFSVSYLHMDLVVLWFIRNNMQFFQANRAKCYAVLAGVFILAVAIRVDCMTGVVGCVVLVASLMLLNTQFQRQFLWFRSAGLLSVSLVASVVFPFIADWVVSIPMVRILIEEVLSRNTTLTGRLSAFTAFAEKMSGHWMWGFGYGNGNLASERLFGLANTQNALLQWILETGVPTTLALVLLMIMTFRPIARSPKQNLAMPMVVLVYVYIILGTVEITFSVSFLLWIALIFAQINEKDQYPVRLTT